MLNARLIINEEEKYVNSLSKKKSIIVKKLKKVLTTWKFNIIIKYVLRKKHKWVGGRVVKGTRL